MTRKKHLSKKGKGIITGLTIGLVGMACIGAVGALSHGFKDWNYKDWFKPSEKDERTNLVKVDLTNDVKGSQLNETTIISFLNEGLETPIFKDVLTTTSTDESTQQETQVAEIGYCYKDNGGLKLGSSTYRGYFTINLVEDYTFNRCKIIGRNYSALNNQTNIYSCDVTSIGVNGAEKQAFGTNEEDTSKIAPTEEKTFTFDTAQTQFKIESDGKRCTLLAIELWTE